MNSAFEALITISIFTITLLIFLNQINTIIIDSSTNILYTSLEEKATTIATHIATQIKINPNILKEINKNNNINKIIQEIPNLHTNSIIEITYPQEITIKDNTIQTPTPTLINLHYLEKTTKNPTIKSERKWTPTKINPKNNFIAISRNNLLINGFEKKITIEYNTEKNSLKIITENTYKDCWILYGPSYFHNINAIKLKNTKQEYKIEEKSPHVALCTSNNDAAIGIFPDIYEPKNQRKTTKYLLIIQTEKDKTEIRYITQDFVEKWMLEKNVIKAVKNINVAGIIITIRVYIQA